MYQAKAMQKGNNANVRRTEEDAESRAEHQCKGGSDAFRAGPQFFPSASSGITNLHSDETFAYYDLLDCFTRSAKYLWRNRGQKIIVPRTNERKRKQHNCGVYSFRIMLPACRLAFDLSHHHLSLVKQTQ